MSLSTVVPANLGYVSTLEKLSENPLTVGTAIAECLNVIRAYEISAAKVSFVASALIPLTAVDAESYVINKHMYEKLMASKRLVDLLSGKI